MLPNLKNEKWSEIKKNHATKNYTYSFFDCAFKIDVPWLRSIDKIACVGASREVELDSEAQHTCEEKIFK